MIMTTIRPFILIAALVACSSRKDSAGGAAKPAVAQMAATEKAEATTKGGESGNEDGARKVTQSGLDDKHDEDNRKIIRTGRIELVVPTYDEARAKIDALVTSVKGYVDSTQVN